MTRDEACSTPHGITKTRPAGIRAPLGATSSRGVGPEEDLRSRAVTNAARRIDYAADGSGVGLEILSPSIGVNLTGLPSADGIAALLERLHLPAARPAS